MRGIDQAVFLHAVDDFGDGRQLGNGVGGDLGNARLPVLVEDPQDAPAGDIKINLFKQSLHVLGVLTVYAGQPVKRKVFFAEIFAGGVVAAVTLLRWAHK
ncbi:hypothetical protein D3C84_1090950 [compost metagenome]